MMAAERHHDLGEVALGRLVDAALLGEEVGGGQVRAEEVAAEQELLLLHVGRHRLRPVHPGGVDELQRQVAEREAVTVGHGREALVGQVEQVDEHPLAAVRADDLRLRIALEHGGQGAGVVLLGVVGDHVVDPRHVGELRQEDLGEGRVDGVDERRLVAAEDEVDVVARAVGEGDERVEEPPVPVDRADERDPVGDPASLHGTPLQTATRRAEAGRGRPRKRPLRYRTGPTVSRPAHREWTPRSAAMELASRCDGRNGVRYSSPALL